MLDHVVSIMWPSKTAWGARQLAAGGPTARLAGQGEANRQKAVGGSVAVAAGWRKTYLSVAGMSGRLPWPHGWRMFILHYRQWRNMPII